MRYFLEDEEIGLRHLDLNDCSGDYSYWFNDEEVCSYNNHYRFPMTQESLEQFVARLATDRSQVVFAVDYKEESAHIGNISLQGIDYINRSAEIAFIFGNKNYWSRGFATKAASLVIQHAFKELNMNRIYFGTSEKNIAMQKVGEKLKFHMGGVKRQAIFKHGEYLDIYDYDLLREEWSSDMA